MAKKEGILAGHKKVGKKLIPPMMQLPKMQALSYVDDILPELLWLGLINDRIGFAEGTRFFKEFLGATAPVRSDMKSNNLACVSSYGILDGAARGRLIQELTSSGLLVPLTDYLQPLTALYPRFPLGFLGTPTSPRSNGELVDELKACVSGHADKYETPGIVLNGNVLLSRLITKTITFSNTIKIPDFDTIFTDPESEEAQRAAAFMRSNALAELAMNGRSPWSEYFWRRSYELSPCELADEVDNE
jgi:hypothetical protein